MLSFGGKRAPTPDSVPGLSRIGVRREPERIGEGDQLGAAKGVGVGLIASLMFWWLLLEATRLLG